MDEQQNNTNRPVNPRRKKRSQLQVFKEAYLPVIIAAVAVLLIIVFIVGSISRAVEKRKAEEEASIAASNALVLQQEKLAQEAQRLIAEAEPLAAQYDYLNAIALLESFSGNIDDYPELDAKHSEYQAAQAKMVAWEDPSKVVNLSFQLLVADAERTFNNETYATLFNKNFVTTTEFSNILQQLYDNGYVLVSMDDFVSAEQSNDGKITYTNKTLYLPEGKKPLMLTQTNVNYNIYLIDSNGDKFADKDGGGFATRMILDENGRITCEMINSTGQTVTGAFDLVPILNSFIELHPDFSYQGARATLALTGYNGLFGYRTNPDLKDYFGVEAYNKAVAGATEIANALLAEGYEFACYTYENIAYGDSETAGIQADLTHWNEEVVPILGQIDTLVYAQNSDIANDTGAYSGEKFDLLQSNGFTKYIGFCSDGITWASLNGSYLRQGRLLVSGSTMAHHADWFTGMFDAASVLDTTARGSTPS